MANGNIIVQPSAVDTENTSSVLVDIANNALGRGADSLSYNTFSSSGTLRTIGYLFNTSSVPSGAENIEIYCHVGATAPTSLQIRTAEMLIGTSTIDTKTLTNQKPVSLTSSAVSRADLDALRLRLSLKSGFSGAVKYYGADLIAQYTYNNEQFYIKISGSWQPARKVYKKVGGLWVEQTDLSGVVEPGVKYKPGTT